MQVKYGWQRPKAVHSNTAYRRSSGGGAPLPPDCLSPSSSFGGSTYTHSAVHHPATGMGMGSTGGSTGFSMPPAPAPSYTHSLSNSPPVNAPPLRNASSGSAGGGGSSATAAMILSGSSNDFFQFSTHEGLGVGGAGHLALWLDNELLEGASHPCDTFGNPCLASCEEFAVAAVELWHI